MIEESSTIHNLLFAQLNDLVSEAAEVGELLGGGLVAPGLQHYSCRPATINHSIPFGEGMSYQATFGVAMHTFAESEAFTRLTDYCVQQLIFLLVSMMILIQLLNLLVVLKL